MQKVVTITAFIVIALGTGVWAYCPSAYIDLGTGCYHFGIQEVTSWEQAYFTCKLEMNGYLVEIESQQEQDNLRVYIQTVLNPAGEYTYYLGATDLLKENEFRWMTSGNLLTYNAWPTGEPDDLNGNEDCMMFNSGRNYAWFDMECTGNHPGFPGINKAICETDPIE